MRQVETFGRIARRGAWAIAGTIAMAVVLTAAGCGGDDNPPPDNQCLAQFAVTAETCTQMKTFLHCGSRSWSAPDNCNLASCDCAWAITCGYSFQPLSSVDCSGVVFGLQCGDSAYDANTKKCDGVQCFCFATPTPANTATATPIRTPTATPVP